jgi:hypothetical protein
MQCIIFKCRTYGDNETKILRYVRFEGEAFPDLEDMYSIQYGTLQILDVVQGEVKYDQLAKYKVN